MSLLMDRRAIALLLAASLTIMSNATISPALPEIEARFSDTPNAALLTRLLVTAPSLMVALIAPFAGLAADRFGRKRQVLLGVLLFALFGSAGLVITDLHLLLASRLVLGIAVAMVMTAQGALLGDTFGGEARARFMGYQIAATNFGGFLFVALAGWLAGIEVMWPFAIYAIGFLYLPYLWRALPEGLAGAREDGAGPRPGDEGGAPGWQLLLGSVVAMSGLTFVIFYLVPTQTPYYLATLGHDDAQVAEAVLSAMILMGGVTALAFGPVRKRLGRGGTPALGYSVMALGFFILQSSEAVPVLILAAGTIGAGFCLVIPNFVAIVLDAAPAHRRGMATGAITTSIFLGQFLSPVFSTPLIHAVGYGEGFLIAAGILLLMAVGVAIGLRQPQGEAVTPTA